MESKIAKSDSSAEVIMPHVSFPWRVAEPENEDEISIFFTNEMIQRLITCPNINEDLTDDWGMFGYEPGFIFVEGTAKTGVHCINDMAWLKAATLQDIGEPVFGLSHFDHFPRKKFDFTLITPTRKPKIYKFLLRYLKRVGNASRRFESVAALK